MANRITTQVITDKGNTSELYQFVDSVRTHKNGDVKVVVNNYLNQTARQADESDKVKFLETAGLREIYYFTGKDMHYGISEAYADIAALQKAEGRTVESDASGNWTVV